MKVYADRNGYLFLSMGPASDRFGNIWWLLEDDIGQIVVRSLGDYEYLGEL